MHRFAVPFFIGVNVAVLPLAVMAADWELRQAEGLARQQAGMSALDDFGVNNYGYYGQPGYYYGSYAYPAPVYDPYYGVSNYNYSYPYSNFPSYPNPYFYSNYNPFYNPGMYNPNTSFVNPPSSLNYPTRYPRYSESYIYN